jgi:hypothetical protein
MNEDEPVVDITIKSQEPEEENLEQLIQEKLDTEEKEIILDVDEDDEESIKILRRHINTPPQQEKVVSLEGIRDNGNHLIHSLKEWIRSGMEMFDSVFMRIVAVLLCIALVVLLVLAIPKAAALVEAGVQSLVTPPAVTPAQPQASFLSSPSLMNMFLPLIISQFIIPKLF